MKRKSIYRILAVLFTATVFFAACTKEDQDVKLAPKISTAQVLSVTSDGATVEGFVIAQGDGFTERGVCYNTAANPTVANSKAIYTGATTGATFNVAMSGLAYATKYYVRAYAIDANGVTTYGEEFNFSTLPILPQLTTTEVTAITMFTAKSGGNITLEGGAPITARGVCFGIKANPTISDSKTSDSTGTGVFTSSLTKLNNGTKYYVRAYATNSAGTAYGQELSFTTVAYPTAIYALGDATTAGWDNTKAIKIDQTSTAGVYYAILDLTAAKGLKFIQTLGSWQPQYGQAAGKPAGTLGANYGGGTDPDNIITPSPSGQYKVTVDMSKMTYTIAPIYPDALFMIGDGVGDWDWAKTNLPMVPVNGTPNKFWKIVWMNATGGFKFAPQKEWKDDFGKTGSATVGADGTVYAKGGDNIPVPGTAGYYMVVVDLATNKIAISDAKVYLMGSVYDDSWTAGNPAGLFTVDNANSIITITKTLKAGNLRMYASHPWITDWWRAEFNIYSGKIEFRGNGGDQAAVPVTAGSHKIDLNFRTGAGAIN